MKASQMINILSEEILNCKVDRHETEEIDGGMFTIIHILV